MDIYNIYFSNIKTVSAFYQAIICGMKYPDWCGENPNAIWDMLTVETPLPATIILHDIESLPQNIQKDLIYLKNMLTDLKEQYKEKVEIIYD